MTQILALTIGLQGCLLWDSRPYSDNVARLTDADKDGTSVAEGDCNDADPDIYPGAIDTCDSEDNDCDGTVDEDASSAVWCQDVDGDGFGDIAYQTRACVADRGWVQDCTDCDDASREVNPSAIESCNGLDDNCDGLTDPADAEGSEAWHLDADGDGYGARDVYTYSCTQPPGTSTSDSDCDDTRSDTYPGAKEICNDGHLNDCDGLGATCGWRGEQILSTPDAAFVKGPEARQEYLGFAVGFIDANADGVDDILLASSGAMYGDDTAGALHIWYGAPSGARQVTESAAHVVGQNDLYLGSIFGADVAHRVTDPSTGESQILVTTEGFSSDFDTRGVLLTLGDAVYGEVRVTPDNVFARGASEMESFGSTLAFSDSLVDEGPSLVIGAPYYSEHGNYAGAVYVTTLAAPDGSAALSVLRGIDSEAIGASLLSESDLSGDGIADLVLGSDVSGTMFLFEGPLAGTLTTTDSDRYIYDDGLIPNTSITTPDLDGDGLADIATERGFAVVLHSGRLADAGHRPSVIATLSEDPPAGASVDFALMTGDPQGDGIPDLVVGVPYLDGPKAYSGMPEAGAVVVLSLDRNYDGSRSLREEASAVFYGPDARANVGCSLSLGDVNADGFDDLLVGAPDWSGNGYTAAGAVWFILGGGI